MAAPSPPFTTSASVAYCLQAQNEVAADFNDIDTVPTKTAVDQFITWISAQIEQRFGMAGYKVPLTEISGESWPTSQTNYLQMVATFGAAAMAGGHAMKPAPSIGPDRPGGSGNVFQDLYSAELDSIFTFGRRPGEGATNLRFRAQYWIGTVAERAVVNPRGPTTDFMEGKYDPMRQLSNWDVADKILHIQQSMSDLQLSWDYLYSLYDINKGFATSIYEI